MGSYQINVETLLNSLQDIRSLTIKKRAEIMTIHSAWDLKRDVRLVVFTLFRNTLNNAHISLMCLSLHVSEKKWWWDTAKTQITDEDLDTTTMQLETFIRVAYINCIMTSVETCFRCILKKINPDSYENGTAAFKNIYDHLLRSVGLGQWITLLDLFRNVRNTIHNNGVYFHKSGKNHNITYLGIYYCFEIGKKIEFITWEFLMTITADITEMLHLLVNTSQVASVPEILEPGQA